MSKQGVSNTLLWSCQTLDSTAFMWLYILCFCVFVSFRQGMVWGWMVPGSMCRVYIIVLCYFSTKCRVYIIVLCYFSTKCREYIIVPCYFSTKCLFVLQFLSSQTSPWQRCAQTTTLCAGTETAAFPLTRPVMGGLTARMPVTRASTTAVSPALWSRGKGRNTKATFKCYYALHSYGGLFSSVVIKALCLTTSTLQKKR